MQVVLQVDLFTYEALSKMSLMPHSHSHTEHGAV